MCLKESCFPTCWKVSFVVPVFKNVVERSIAKNYHPVNLLWLVKSLKNLQIIGLLITYRNVVFYLISSMILGLLKQLHLFWQLSDKINRAFNRSGATRGVSIDISKVFDRVRLAGLIHKLNSYGFSGQIFGLISYFISVICGFEWFLKGSLYKNIQLMLELLKVSFLVLHFSYYMLMTFLMTLFVILLSMLML